LSGKWLCANHFYERDRLQATILDFRQAHFAQSLVLGNLFLAILWASMRVTRFWCRAI
jgi:hypothetical protein